MVRRVDAIFSQGTFRPLEPLSLPEGTRIQLSFDEQNASVSMPSRPKIHTPALAHPIDAKDFVREVREIGDAGV
jgi:predicted DNA-binding antitoxin AbrB/MazE fold protein